MILKFLDFILQKVGAVLHHQQAVEFENFFFLEFEIKNTQSLPFSSVQLLSRVRLFATPWTAAIVHSFLLLNSILLFEYTTNCLSISC